jgi:hypothetical protein
MNAITQPRRIQAPAVSQDTVTFSIPDIGRRINAASVESNVLGKAKVDMPEHSLEYRHADVRSEALLDERIALQDLAIVLQPKTLVDAAVQLGLLFYSMDSATDTDDVEEMRRAVKKIERTIVGIARVVAREVGVDLTQFGETDLVSMMNSRCPETVSAEVPA